MMASTGSFDLRIYWEMLWRRKWIVIVTFLLSIALGFYFALTAKPQYAVSSTVLLREIDLEFNNGKNVISPRVSATDDLGLLKTKILSPMILGMLIDKVGMLDDSTLSMEAADIRVSYPKLGLEEIKRSILIEKLQDKILNIRIQGDNMIQIKAEHEDPEVAFVLVSSLIDIFIEQTQHTEMSGLQSGLNYSSEQMEIYKKRLESAEARLQNAKAGTVLTKFDDQQLSDLHAENLQTISLAAANQLELEKRILGDASATLSGSEPSLSSHSSASIDKLFNQQLAALGQLTSILESGKAGDEQMFQINNEIKDLDAALQVEVEALANASVAVAQRAAWAESKMATLRVQFIEKKKKATDRILASYTESRRASMTKAPMQQLTEERLLAEVEQARQMYQLFLKQKEGAELERALKSAQSPFVFRLIDPPQRPLSSIAMSKRTRLIVSCAMGLSLGLILAIGVEQLDRSLKTIDDVELHLQTPVFGLMPKIDTTTFQFKLDSGEAVDIQRIASKLMKQLLRESKSERHDTLRWSKTILITSSVQSEGKSTFSSYLAACMAEMLKETSVLLVDADLRRGQLHKTFKLDNSSGLGNVLEEGAQDIPGFCLQQAKNSRLHVITSGHSTESPLTLFGSQKFARVIDQLKKYYDLIILDTPPVIPVNDTMFLSRHADTILYVVKAGETPREIAKRGIGLVRSTESHFSGVIMNNMRHVLPYYYRHNYYGYDYEHSPTTPTNGKTNGALRGEMEKRAATTVKG